MTAYMATFNIVSGSLVGLRLWAWASARYPSVVRLLAPDTACIAGAIIGAVIAWASA